MKIRNSSYLLLTILAIVIISLLLFIIKKPLFQSNKNNGNDTIQALHYNQMGDNVRENKQDSSLFYYQKALLLLYPHKNEITERRIMASSYMGIAYIYVGRGEYKKATENNSIALSLAKSINNFQLQAKTKNLLSIILCQKGKFDDALVIYNEAELIAMRANDLQLQAKIWSNRAQIYFYRGEEQKALESFEKTLTIALLSKNNPVIAGSYLNLGLFYQNTGNYKTGLANYEKAMSIFKKIDEKTSLLLCYQNIGSINYWTGNWDKAIEYYNQSLNLTLQMKDKPNEGKAYHNLAEVYSSIGDKTKSIAYYFKSIIIKEQLKDKMGIASDYTSLSDFYFQRNDYQKAMDYLKKSFRLNKELGYLQGIAGNYTNIGNVYNNTNRKDSAIGYYMKSFEVYKKINNPAGLSNLYINLGLAYCAQQKFALAGQYVYKAIQIKTNLSDQEGIATAYYHLANIYFQQGLSVSGVTKNSYYDQAIASGLKSFKMAEKLKAMPVMKEASLVLKDAYQKKGEPDRALYFAEKYSTLMDSLMGKDKTQALTFAEARWNSEKKQNEISKLQNKQKLNQEIIMRNEADSHRQKMLIYFVITLTLLTVVLSIVIILYIQRRRDRIFQKQLQSIAKLRMQNARNTMSPHFFFNALSSLSGVADQREVLKGRLTSLSLLLRKVIENIDQTAITLKDELSTVKAYIELQNANLSGALNVEYHIAEGTNLERLIPAMILQIPVENAIKHGLIPLEGEKKLRISIADDNGHQQIVVDDNGIGLKASAGRSTGTGTGLKVLLQTIHLLNSSNTQKIQFSISERNHHEKTLAGTNVTILIPFDYDFVL